jgi:hypothetical protein
MYTFLQTFYENFKIIIFLLFEAYAMRRRPDYDKLPDEFMC